MNYIWFRIYGTWYAEPTRKNRQIFANFNLKEAMFLADCVYSENQDHLIKDRNGDGAKPNIALMRLKTWINNEKSRPPGLPTIFLDDKMQLNHRALECNSVKGYFYGKSSEEEQVVQ